MLEQYLLVIFHFLRKVAIFSLSKLNCIFFVNTSRLVLELVLWPSHLSPLLCLSLQLWFLKDCFQFLVVLMIHLVFLLVWWKLVHITGLVCWPFPLDHFHIYFLFSKVLFYLYIFCTYLSICECWLPWIT